ncbi:MAG: Flp pilus assembly protein CpaB [Hyphomonadaceae bacterium]|nr:Flp pilus assembly protein CpaB [Hyphomonadaceae bacterium]
MSARQLIVLAVAAIAAIGALLLIRAMGNRAPAPAPEAAAPIAGEQVLVAARDIPQGAALSPSDLAVATFPNGSVSASFVNVSTQPSAQADYVGAVTRRAFVQGEPIVTNSVVQPEGRGFLAAQLPPGYRAVAIEINKHSAAGGYIQPNDRVDVLMARRFSEGSQQRVTSQVVLEDVRVLALNDRTQPQTSGQAPEIVDATVAVLELAAEDARVLAQADQLGEISLMLRGVQVDTVGMNAPRRNGVGQSSGSVRVHAFGSVSGGGR